MQQFIHKKLVFILSGLLFIALACTTGIFLQHGKAGEPGALSIKAIDYDNMELTINLNNNSIVYYSTNKKKWNEADGLIANETDTSSTMTYDISWISATGDTTLYFRGNNNKTTLPVTIPGYNKSFKVKFDKASGEFDFQNTEGAEIIRWRKTTDYTWHYVSLQQGNGNGSSKTSGDSSSETNGDKTNGDGSSETNAQSLENFQKEISAMRVKGVKLVFQIAPKAWENKDNVGMRPSKDVKVTVSAKRSAPNVKVNIKKLTVNTKTTMEWTNVNPVTVAAVNWVKCTKANMTLSELGVDGSEETVLYFHTEANSSNCESKDAALVIPARATTPAAVAILNQIPGTAAGKSKATLAFSNVPEKGCEYFVSKNGSAIDETKVSWKKITRAKTVNFTEKALPAGAKIYVRDAGVALNVNKKIDLKLPSNYSEIIVPAYATPTASN